MASKKISVVDLDFDGIKTNLKEYLKAQDAFSDYDFEGSALSVLVDVLAYNTHYNVLHDNMAVNEAFLDSASKRSSVVSKAKELGYIPSSAKSPIATVTLSSSEPLSLAKDTPFVAKADDMDYSFYLVQGCTLAYNSTLGKYVAENVSLREGTVLQSQTLYQTGVKVYIPNTNADMSSMTVHVYENVNTSSYETYTNAYEQLELDGNSTVYFIKELEDQTYELEFGDGNIGKALVDGNLVKVTYTVTAGAAANSIRKFTYGGSTLPTALYVTTVIPSVGGANAESIQSIKWNAPRAYTTQNRCVTIDDYKNIIFRMYPNAESVNVWGGEDNNPPSYGDVFISIRPYNSERLSDAEKSYILGTIIGPRKMVTMHPKLVDPTYIHVEVTTSFHYDPTLAAGTSADLISAVRDSILSYGDKNLNRFGSILRYSNLTRVIDDSDESILSSITTIKLHYHILPTYNEDVKYKIDLGNPIYNSGVPEDSVLSSAFYVINVASPVHIADTPIAGTDKGTLKMFYYNGTERVYVSTNVGTVTYSKGLIEFTGVIIVGLAEDVFKFVIKPQSNDVASNRNDIVDIPANLLVVNAIEDRATTSFTFASSRN